MKANNLPNKKAKSEETREPERRNIYIRRIADFDLIIDQLETGCRKCKVSPLKITNADLNYTLHPNRMRIVCENFQTQSSLIIHSREVEGRLVLSCLHNSIGYSHLEALLNIIGLQEGTFKGLERSVGHTVDTALSGSCTKWKNEEKKLEISIDTDSQLKGAYDTSWSKRGVGYNALTWRGIIVDTNTGKCI